LNWQERERWGWRKRRRMMWRADYGSDDQKDVDEDVRAKLSRSRLRLAS